MIPHCGAFTVPAGPSWRRRQTSPYRRKSYRRPALVSLRSLRRSFANHVIVRLSGPSATAHYPAGLAFWFVPRTETIPRQAADPLSRDESCGSTAGRPEVVCGGLPHVFHVGFRFAHVQPRRDLGECDLRISAAENASRRGARYELHICHRAPGPAICRACECVDRRRRSCAPWDGASSYRPFLCFKPPPRPMRKPGRGSATLDGGG
jgi:hypothetical protein